MIPFAFNRLFPDLQRLRFAAMMPLLAFWVAASASPVTGSSESPVTRFAGRELAFEPESDDPSTCLRYFAHGRNYQFLLSPAEVRFTLVRTERAPAQFEPGRYKLLTPRQTSAIVAGMEFVHANSQAHIRGEGELPGKVNYFIGGDPSRWRSAVPTFAKVRVEELYSGIDVVYYGNRQQLEYDFWIGPHADPAAITMRFAGVDTVSVDAQGELVIRIAGTELRQPRPLIYQNKQGVRVAIEGGYRCDRSGAVGFELGTYDRELPLVIDPRLEYSSYFGGNGGDLGLEIKVDANGNIYFTGQTLSTQFPYPAITNGFQPVFGGGTVNGDAFLAKVDSSGTNVIYLTYLGGTGDDGGLDLAIDFNGNAYVCGLTQSSNFPVKNALFPKISGTADSTFGIYPTEGFVTELNTSGSALVFSTYLGGSAFDLADGIALDPAGNVYVTGITASTDFPLHNPLASQTAFSGGGYDAFVTKFSPGGSSLVYSTYLGGLALDEGQGIAADSFGFAYVTGYTASTNFPITFNASQPLLNLTNATSSYDAFLTKFTPQGALVFSTFLGGTYNDFGYRVAVDQSGFAYVTGPSQSLDFPNTITNVPGLVRTSQATNYIVNYDVFLTKFTPAGQRVYSTIFGGTNDDVGWDVAVDAHGDAFIIGTTFSDDFPTTNVFDLIRATNSGLHDVFVTALNSNATALFYSGYLGGSLDDFGYGIAVDPESSAYLVGNTFSTNFPVTAVHIQSSLDGASDNFIAKIRLADPMLSASLVNDQLQLQWPASAPLYTLESALSLTPPILWTPVPISPIFSEGVYMLSLPATNAEMGFRLRSP